MPNLISGIKIYSMLASDWIFIYVLGISFTDERNMGALGYVLNSSSGQYWVYYMILIFSARQIHVYLCPELFAKFASFVPIRQGRTRWMVKYINPDVPANDIDVKTYLTHRRRYSRPPLLQILIGRLLDAKTLFALFSRLVGMHDMVI